MFKVECVTAQKPDAITKAVNDTISTLTSSGYKILNVYPITIGDSRYVSAIINYETAPASEAQYVTIDTLNGMLTTYAKKTDIPATPTVPTKVSQLTNDSGYITRSTADSLYALKSSGT